MHNFEECEIIAESTIIKEVINTSSIYFGELMIITHKAYAVNTAWYKGKLSSGELLWFKSNELEEVE